MVGEQAKGNDDTIFIKMEAEARGLYEILNKQAKGYGNVVEAAGGGSTQAF